VAGKTPNSKLESVMRRAKCSNNRLARLVVEEATSNGVEVHYDHVAVGRWLNGMHPRGATPHFIAKVLSRMLPEPVSLADIGLEDTSGAIVLGLEYPDDPRTSLDTLTGLVRADLADGSASALLSVTADAWSDLMVKWLLSPDTVRISPFKISPASPVEAIRATTDAFSRLDYRFGGGQARRSLIQYVESDVLPDLSGFSMNSANASEVLCAVAALLRLTAWTAYDTGAHGLAQRYFTQALRLANAGGDRMLGGRILAGMSHQANFLGYFDHAINLARAAQRGASGYATPTAMSLYYAMEARAQASKGDEGACLAALSQAERWFNSRTPENDPEWMRYFDEAELAAEFAHCFRDLGRNADAIAYAERSLRISESLYVRSLGFVRTVLAAAQVASGNVDEGIATASEVLTTAAVLKSRRSKAYVEDFIKRIMPYADVRSVRDFVDTASVELSTAN
jgi:hypothetical protein